MGVTVSRTLFSRVELGQVSVSGSVAQSADSESVYRCVGVCGFCQVPEKGPDGSLVSPLEARTIPRP